MLKVQLSPAGFLRAFVLYLAPALIASFALAVLTHGSSEAKRLSESVPMIVLAVLIGPVVETFILIYPTSIAGQAQKNRWVASAIGAAPLILLHFANGWQSVVAVSWGFTWSAYCWLKLSETEARFWPRYAFLVGMHAMGNLVVVSLAALGD